MKHPQAPLLSISPSPIRTYEINSWKVCEEDTLSDHKLIEFTMDDTHEFDTPKTFGMKRLIGKNLLTSLIPHVKSGITH